MSVLINGFGEKIQSDLTYQGTMIYLHSILDELRDMKPYNYVAV